MLHAVDFLACYFIFQPVMSKYLVVCVFFDFFVTLDINLDVFCAILFKHNSMLSSGG